MDLINRLRQKTPAAKRTIAFVTSGVVTLAIFGLWVTVFHFGIDQKPASSTATVANADGSSSASDVNPFSAFWNVVSTGWDGLANNISQIKSGASQAQNFVDKLATTSADTASQSASVANTQSVSQPAISQPVPQPNPQSDVFVLSGSSTDSSNITQ